LCGWNHRFDDPRREYRTIYAADKKETCLREVLADLRPDKKAVAEFKKLFGDDDAVECAGQEGAAIPLSGRVAELGAVCAEYGLVLN
jgi:hypothetical protein